MKKLHTFIRTTALTGILILGTAHMAWAAGWQQDETGWKYEKEDGTYASGTWQKVQDVWYYFDGDGYMQTGWLQQGEEWYYLDASGAMIENETREIDGVSYTFDSDGRLTASDSGNYDPATRQQMEQWFYATYAVIANLNGWNKEYFVSSPGVWEGEAQYRLSKAWGITDRESALEIIRRLNEGMHRIQYQNEMEVYEYFGYTSLSEEQLASLLEGNEAAYDMIVAYQRGGEGAIDAWDYCRAMQVTREAYLAGYITEKEELDQMLQTAQTIQGRFSSWSEMMESYLRGYEYWAWSRESYEERKKIYEMVNVFTSYFQIPWDLTLQKAW